MSPSTAKCQSTSRAFQRRRSLVQERAGLTLIEVMLVLVILSILAAAVVIPLSRTSNTAMERAARVNIDGLEKGLKLYYMDTLQYPSDLEALRSAPGDLSNPNKWKGPYIDKTIPRDPWDRPYQYAYPGSHNQESFDIWSVGPDGQDGSEDDIGNWEETS
ncbi:Type II secretion system protein GspG [Planctomycetales bacterium 10988]|nr:Type II secretion system protein GspG [Planctomycetales bacterium 10988]